MNLQGAMTAMITPFKDGSVDHDRLREHVRKQVAAGIDALVPVGTTGESPTLTHQEHRAVIETVVQEAKEASGNKSGGVKVIAGTGSNATTEALELTQHAKAVGADAALMVNPYYNKPSQEGMKRHFRTIADAVGLPIVLYNIPGRCGVAMTPQTVAELAEHEMIVAIKEATGSVDSASEIASLCGLTILSGDDSMTLPLMSVGGRGVISVLSNIVPKKVKALTDAALAGDLQAARSTHLDLFSLGKALLTLDTNPAPIKAAMALLGQDTGELRLPMCALAQPQQDRLKALLQAHNLL